MWISLMSLVFFESLGADGSRLGIRLAPDLDRFANVELEVIQWHGGEFHRAAGIRLFDEDPRIAVHQDAFAAQRKFRGRRAASDNPGQVRSEVLAQTWRDNQQQ